MKNKIPSITIGLDLGDKKHAIVRDKFVSDHSKSSRSPPVVWRGRTVPDAGSRHAYNGFWQGMGVSVFVYPFLPIRFCVSVFVANQVLSRQSNRQSSQIIPAPAAAVT
jgi:hypothetical protein